MAEYRREPNILPVDHGYASDNVYKTIEARDVVPVIPMRKTQQAAYHCRSKPLPAAQPRRARLHLVEERPSHRHPLRQTAESLLGFIDIKSIRLVLPIPPLDLAKAAEPDC